MFSPNLFVPYNPNPNLLATSPGRTNFLFTAILTTLNFTLRPVHLPRHYTIKICIFYPPPTTTELFAAGLNLTQNFKKNHLLRRQTESSTPHNKARYDGKLVTSVCSIRRKKLFSELRKSLKPDVHNLLLVT